MRRKTQREKCKESEERMGLMKGRDETNGRITACFTAELVDSEGNTTLLYNTNFWRIRGDKFQEVYIYMSGENPLT